MKKPISSGDMCEVIGGLMGQASPNLGLVVLVKHRVYECPQLGVIWRCEAAYAERLVLGPACTCPPGHADFAQSWLRKIEDVPPVTSKAAEVEHAQ